jgi:hypothetical protein
MFPDPISPEPRRAPRYRGVAPLPNDRAETNHRRRPLPVAETEGPVEDLPAERWALSGWAKSPCQKSQFTGFVGLVKSTWSVNENNPSDIISDVFTLRWVVSRLNTPENLWGPFAFPAIGVPQF